MMYFVIRHNGCEHISRKELVSRLNNEYYGANASFIREGDVEGETSDTRNWDANWILILEGRPVQPEPVQATVGYGIGYF